MLEFDYEVAEDPRYDACPVFIWSPEKTVKGHGTFELNAIDTALRNFFANRGMDCRDEITETPEGILVRLK